MCLAATPRERCDSRKLWIRTTPAATDREGVDSPSASDDEAALPLELPIRTDAPRFGPEDQLCWSDTDRDAEVSRRVGWKGRASSARGHAATWRSPLCGRGGAVIPAWLLGNRSPPMTPVGSHHLRWRSRGVVPRTAMPLRDTASAVARQRDRPRGGRSDARREIRTRVLPVTGGHDRPDYTSRARCRVDASVHTPSRQAGVQPRPRPWI